MSTAAVQQAFPPLTPPAKRARTASNLGQATISIDTIDDLLRQRAQEPLADEPIVAYPSCGTDYAFYTPRQLDTLVEQAAVHYAQFVPQRLSSADPVQVIGLLGPSSFDYLITLLAVSRLGHSVLFLSTRISENAYVNLIEETKASTLLIHPNFREVSKKVQKRTKVHVQPICGWEDDDAPALSNPAKRLPTNHLDGSLEADHVCWIIHSSGSTGLPKPIYQTQLVVLKNYANNFGLRGFITLPLFHAHGISCVFRAIHSRKLIYMYNADLPLTASNLLVTLRDHPIEILYAVPYALKLLGESKEGLRVLSELKLVMFGGSACPKPIGDKLVRHGVFLISHYGTTETGQLMTSFRDRDDLDWDYVRVEPKLQPYLRWEEEARGIYELCILDGWPSKVASNRPDGSYATKDLFEKHPTKENAWRYYARKDDTLVLENGEKANPLLVEGVARENANVSEAIAFGANKPRIGLFLIPSRDTKYCTDGALIENVWKSLDQSNAVIPAFARISKDMVRVLSPDIDYRKTDKGTVIRAAFYRDFADLIEAAYNEDNVGSGSLVLEGPALINYLRGQLLELIDISDPLQLKDNTDLFSFGVDSLQSIRLRSVLVKTLDLGGRKLPQNFVFENPSLAAIASELTRLRLGENRGEKTSVEQRMTAMIDKYSHFQPHVPVTRTINGEHIAVTGATGSLGANVVAQLASSNNIDTVYCLVRASSPSAAEDRVRKSLDARYVAQNLSENELKKIVAIPADLSDPLLGMDQERYDGLTAAVTGVVHCAWSVNFNWALESFEKDCIAGTRHLLDLCLKAKGPTSARFAFCSSVSTVAATPTDVAPEALPASLTYAQEMGYAQSKLVTEHIVTRASRETGMQARVLRIGQIIADTKAGIWNASEAIPMMFQTAETMHSLPQLDDMLSWTPVDVVASTVIDLTFAPEVGEVVNATNPTLINWTQDLLPLLREAGLAFEELPPREWITRLRDSDPDPSANPPIKLLDFFAKKYDHDERRRTLTYETRNATTASPALRAVGGINADLVKKFINYFRQRCWNRTDTPTTM
ncbi:NRPS-like enzyme [Rhizodiscina lignyota]|uniref:NRPS-like enzyme n=1 Tax=Rhizodiscina lignyota TaxID=1504668 RepID=A0A9P4IH78_9PEZI|nr:NRPS-like enzyme [Rhizodiscina lignyota]